MVDTNRAKNGWKQVMAITLTLLAPASHCFQAGVPKPGGRTDVKTQIVPMFQVVKTMGFTVAELPKSRYYFSRAEVAVMPSGFAGLKELRTVVYLTYGFKKGGLVRVYETKASSQLKVGSLLDAIKDSRVFHDSYRDPSYASKELVINGAHVVVASLKKDLLIDAVKYIKNPTEAPAR